MATGSIAHRTVPPRARWWHRLGGRGPGTGAWGLDDRWHVIHVQPRHDLVVGPGGAFLVTQGIRSLERVRAEASRIGTRLTARLGRPIVVHGVRAVPPTEPQPLDQPMDVTVVSVAVLAAWLRSHPAAWTDREVAGLARAAAGLVSPG